MVYLKLKIADPKIYYVLFPLAKNIPPFITIHMSLFGNTIPSSLREVCHI